MTSKTNEVLQEALSLPAVERASLIDQLIVSLDQPDAQIDALWVQEAERRMALYLAGEMTVQDSSVVLERLESRV